MNHAPESTPRTFLFLAPLLSAALLCLSGCGGPARSGDHPGTVGTVLRVTPSSASLSEGQTVQFTATSPWGGGARWSVQPPSGGTITPEGLFTASGTLGQYTIQAMWNNDVRYAATATARILTPAPPAVTSPHLVLASGAQQTTASGALSNGCVIGEPFLPGTSRNLAGTLEVRHGFHPPLPQSTP